MVKIESRQNLSLKRMYSKLQCWGVEEMILWRLFFFFLFLLVVVVFVFIGTFENVLYSILETNDLVESLWMSTTIMCIKRIIILRTIDNYRKGCAYTMWSPSCITSELSHSFYLSLFCLSSCWMSFFCY